MEPAAQDRVGPTRPGLVESEIDGRIQLFSDAATEAYVLNGTASDVWRLADGSLTLPEIVEALALAYAVPGDQIAGDVAATVADFRTRGLLLR